MSTMLKFLKLCNVTVRKRVGENYHSRRRLYQMLANRINRAEQLFELLDLKNSRSSIAKQSKKPTSTSKKIEEAEENN